MIEIEIKVKIKKPLNAEPNVWTTKNLLEGAWFLRLKLNWTYVFVFIKCIYWLHENINQYIPYLTT
ncbi:hypothetical protein BSR55_06075 [Acinetobacter bereziniae]|nr:hypothetical protein BSR55_06075 [Acinetobacter bereziniae]